LELTAGRFVKVADGAAAAHREAELEVLEALAELQEACTEAALCEHIGKGHSTIGRALKDLCTRGVIESEKRPREDGHGVVTVYRHGGVL
jgi:predicted transcriptional regulator